MSKTIDLTGQVFGRLTVICRHPHTGKNTNALWECVCLCGNTTVVRGADLRSPGSGIKSCGCLSREKTELRNLTHGKSKLPEYVIWKGMKTRCLNSKNKSFPRYGGRGITVCNEWLVSFPDFYKHLGPRPSPKHSLERIDNNAGYFPGNVKWSTVKEQSNNKCNNHRISLGGRTMTFAQWAMTTGINEQTLFARVTVLGWPIKKALSETVQHQRKPRQSHIPPSSAPSDP